MKRPMTKKFLAFGLAFSLAMSAPATTFAASLNDIFTATEAGDTDTSTKTKTTTNSAAVSIDESDEYSVAGVTLDKEELKLKVGKKDTLTAYILLDNDTNGGTESIRMSELAAYDDLMVTFAGRDVKVEELYKNLKFYEEQPAKEKCILGIKHLTDSETKEKTDTAEITATKAGVSTVSVKLGDTYKASATVYAKNYAAGIKLNTVPTQYVKHVVNMNEYLENEGALNITWSAYTLDNNGNKKVYKTMAADGKLTLGAITQGAKNIPDGKVHVRAVAENGKMAETDFVVEAGVPVTGFEPINKNIALDVKTVPTKEITLVVKTGGGDSTDDITWTSNKPEIVSVANAVTAISGNKSTQTFVANKSGKAVITAKATSGKTVKFNVKVTATLQSMSDGADSVYPGMTVDLAKVLNFDPANTDTKVTYNVNKAADKKVYGAVKGNILTAKANVGDDVTFTVDASVKNPNLKATATITVKKSDVKGFNIINKIKTFGDKDTINLTNGKAMDLDVDLVSETIKDKDTMQKLVTWKSSNAKIATIDADGRVELKGDAAGKVVITATVFGVNEKNGKAATLKKTLNIVVKQPIKSLTLKKADNTVSIKTKKVKGEVVPQSQTVTLQVKAFAPKKADKEAITWTVKKTNAEGVFKFVNGKSLADSITNPPKKTTAAVKVNVSAEAKLGDYAVIEAKTATGVKTTATIRVTSKTEKVIYLQKDARGRDKKAVELGIEDATNTINLDAFLGVKADGTVREELTYTVNNAKLANIDGSTLYALGTGTVKVTAATPSGKKATFTVKIK